MPENVFVVVLRPVYETDVFDPTYNVPVSENSEASSTTNVVEPIAVEPDARVLLAFSESSSNLEMP